MNWCVVCYTPVCCRKKSIRRNAHDDCVPSKVIFGRFRPAMNLSKFICEGLLGSPAARHDENEVIRGEKIRMLRTVDEGHEITLNIFGCSFLCSWLLFEQGTGSGRGNNENILYSINSCLVQKLLSDCTHLQSCSRVVTNDLATDCM